MTSPATSPRPRGQGARRSRAARPRPTSRSTTIRRWPDPKLKAFREQAGSPSHAQRAGDDDGLVADRHGHEHHPASAPPRRRPRWTRPSRRSSKDDPALRKSMSSDPHPARGVDRPRSGAPGGRHRPAACGSPAARWTANSPRAWTVSRSVRTRDDRRRGRADRRMRSAPRVRRSRAPAAADPAMAAVRVVRLDGAVARGLDLRRGQWRARPAAAARRGRRSGSMTWGRRSGGAGHEPRGTLRAEAGDRRRARQTGGGASRRRSRSTGRWPARARRGRRAAGTRPRARGRAGASSLLVPSCSSFPCADSRVTAGCLWRCCRRCCSPARSAFSPGTRRERWSRRGGRPPAPLSR